MASKEFMDIEKELRSPDHKVGDVIPYDLYLVIGNGSRDGDPYMLAAIGVDTFNRLWKQDGNGITMIADLSKK